MDFRHLDFYHSPDLLFVISTLRTNLDANSCHLNFLQKWDINSAISTLRAIQMRIFGSHFLGKIHIRGVQTFWPWCYVLTLVSSLPAFFGRSYPSGCIGHRPLVSLALRSYGDRCRPRVPSNPAACFPPFITFWLWFYFWAFFVLGLWNTQFAYSAFIHSAAPILADLKS